jgi:hypothetical protein
MARREKINQAVQDRGRTRYYTLVDESGLKRVTVCLVELDNDVARGISICSFADKFNKAEGRKLAKINALHALKKKENCRPIRSALPIVEKIGLHNEMHREFKWGVIGQRPYKSQYVTKSDLFKYELSLLWGGVPASPSMEAAA